jgi:hypothetical protein
MSSSVCDLGTIRNIIRGVNELPPHTLLCEVIDDAEHSSSTKVFIDINLHERAIIFGFENAATRDQLDNMVMWNPVSTTHKTFNISTCGQGLKFYEFFFRGEQTHITMIQDGTSANPIYIKSRLNSDVIYNHATSPDISETQFSDVLKKNTIYASEDDEITPSIQAIFNNENKQYPFHPKTLIISRKISNMQLLEWLSQPDNINNLKNHLINKYFSEIKSKHLTIYIKFPNAPEFIELGKDSTADIIGSTQPIHEHHSYLYYVKKDFNKCKKGNYLICINNKFFHMQKNGSSIARVLIEPSDEERHSNIFLQFKFIQYNVNNSDEASFKKYMVGTSLEDYSGIYLKIGEKFINSQPITANLTKRNLQGARWYRGVLELMNPEVTKLMLGLQGLKANFNLSQMQSLETTVKQCCTIYKNFCTKYPHEDFSLIDPVTYSVVKTSNEKNTKQSKPGRNYIRVIGDKFYKLGMTFKSNEQNRIFESDEYEKLVRDFPDEKIYLPTKQYIIYVSPEIINAASIEQIVKEYIMELDDVTTYKHKIGDDIREYFHCDDMNTIDEIRQMMVERI